jgi:quinoprotein glucose dehydrogenase
LKILICLLLAATVRIAAADTQWPMNGGAYNIRYSPATQVNRANVNQLQVAWVYDSHDAFKDSQHQISGGANAWSRLSVDPKLGMVFAATGSTSFDFYGANRIGDNLFANCVLALDARTGKRIWHFQGIKHDVWDLDFPAAPSLVTVKRNGQSVAAVAQITKMGTVYVLDRKTGKPLFPVRYRKVHPQCSTARSCPKRSPTLSHHRLSRAPTSSRGSSAW